MLFWTIIKVAFKSLTANKLRSFLAMLGIIIGVGAVVSMLALGAGAQKQVMKRITAMGTNLLIIRAGADTHGGVQSNASRQSLKLDDAEAIINNIKDIESIAQLVTGRGQIKYFNENMNTSIMGAPVSYLEIRNFEIDKGRAFSTVEVDNSARVAVIGAAVAEQLFSGQNPIGERFRVKSINFRVVGVLKAKGDQGWFNPDEMVVIPYTTAMKQLLGQAYLNEIDVKAKEGANLSNIEQALGELLRKRHKLQDGVEDDFRIRNQAEIIDMASTFTRTFSVLLGGIASISLLVGGIGIMNIMLVTVTERTKEIGVRKAIGARNRDILSQFLIESILISGLGGAFGIGLGFAAAAAVSNFTEYQTVVETQSIVLSLVVSGSVGIFFGYYPAMRAARLDPIVALRYE